LLTAKAPKDALYGLSLLMYGLMREKKPSLEMESSWEIWDSSIKTNHVEVDLFLKK